VAQLEKAVDCRPDQAAYHGWLGWALWRARGEAAKGEARDRLDHALALDPDSTEAHALMGSFLCAAGERAAARAHLERTLALRPEQREPIAQLVGLYLDSGEPDQAEKLYRRLIGALGDREPSLRASLWEQLGRLYEGKLGDATAAARAFESAAQITAG
jgi:Tfp pilus assembly protein PilF